MIEVALFPIPDVVAFPGVPVPLHVFEPRYRQLVQDCVNDARLLGVCHTQKTIHKPATSSLNPPSIEKVLSTNQATYKPHPVFSAGPCEILETLPDGRLLANVDMNQRLSLIEERQSLPYRIVGCEPLPDERPEHDERADNMALQARIHTRLIELISPENPELAEQLQSSDWQDLSAEDYSHRIFGCLRFEADIMQQILESTSANTRLAAISHLLERA